MDKKITISTMGILFISLFVFVIFTMASEPLGDRSDMRMAAGITQAGESEMRLTPVGSNGEIGYWQTPTGGFSGYEPADSLGGISRGGGAGWKGDDS